MSCIENNEHNINLNEKNRVERNQSEVCVDEVPLVVQEICENTNVEITSLSHAEDNDNYNNDFNEIKPDKMIINTPKRDLIDKFSELCLICNFKIYPMEKLAIDGKLYHKKCFRCSKCRSILSVGNFNLSNNLIYCRTHFLELFKIRGKYDDNGNIENVVVNQRDDINEPMPTTDTKRLLAKFRQLEAGSTSPYVKSTNLNLKNTEFIDDSTRNVDIPNNELPPPKMAESMVAKFKAMETTKNVPSPEIVQQSQLKTRNNLIGNHNLRLQNHLISPNENINDLSIDKNLSTGDVTLKI